MRSLLVCLVLVLVIGCGKKSEEELAEKLAEQMLEAQIGQGLSVDISGDTVSMKDKDGKALLTAGKAAVIPASFPKDIHVYKGSIVEVAMDMPTGKMITLLSKDTLYTVLATYKKKMSAQGWTEKTSMDMGEQAVLSLEKSGRMVNVTIAKDEESDGTRIMLILVNQ
ncbi:MAG: hypothetical protein KAH23_09690 [Kiritimatiellae bacterium]|nr:hypothetical protein [Kiritimatiellia bacterium]